MGMASCQDWLTEQAPAKTDIKDFFTSTEAAEQTVNAAYVPLQWEYSNDFFPEWFIGDICSDDAIKGGENLTDEATLYDMCNFKTTSNNQTLLDYYRSQWQGIARANLAIEQVGAMETGTDENFTESMKNRLIGEAKFLRARPSPLAGAALTRWTRCLRSVLCAYSAVFPALRSPYIRRMTGNSPVPRPRASTN